MLSPSLLPKLLRVYVGRPCVCMYGYPPSVGLIQNCVALRRAVTGTGIDRASVAARLRDCVGKIPAQRGFE